MTTLKSTTALLEREVLSERVCQGYWFEDDRVSRCQYIPSHEASGRFAWNWALGLIEAQLYACFTYCVLVIRQGASEEDPPSTVLPKTALLIEKLPSPPDPSLVLAEFRATPKRWWLDASGSCPWQQHGWITGHPGNPNTRSHGPRVNR